VAERVVAAIAHRVGGSPSWEGADEEDAADSDAAQLFVVRLFHDSCTVSADSSGALLHRRGYRLATAKAPLRETLAAAMLLGAGWDGSAPLLDPMCGSGTIAIEAALLARRIPPGLRRRFAFERWPGFEPAPWRRALDAARSGIRERAPGPIHASDRDAGAIEAARANAERAGVAEDLTLARAAIAAVEPPPGPSSCAPIASSKREMSSTSTSTRWFHISRPRIVPLPRELRWEESLAERLEDGGRGFDPLGRQRRFEIRDESFSERRISLSPSDHLVEPPPGER
jgi:hypothetical protein